MDFPVSRLDNARGLLAWLRARGVGFSLGNDGQAVVCGDLTRWGRTLVDLTLPGVTLALRSEAGRCVACGVAFPSRHSDYCLPCLWARVEGFGRYQGKRRVGPSKPAVETAQREEEGDLWKGAA